MNFNEKIFQLDQELPLTRICPRNSPGAQTRGETKPE